MRIGIDICDLAFSATGVGSVLNRLLLHLEQNDHENDYFLYQNVCTEFCEANHFYKRIVPLGLYHYWKEQIYYSARSVIDRLDVVHAPTQVSQ